MTARSEAPRPCPLCGGTSGRTTLVVDRSSPEGLDYRVVACAGCGLRYTDPLPTEAELEALYDEAFYGDEQPGLISFERVRLALHRMVLRHRERALLGSAPGRILDVGCGDGDFLHYLAQRGWCGVGAEVSEAGCRRARSRGVEVYRGTLEEACRNKTTMADGSFDAVTLWHVLEHLPDPRGALASAASLLREGGLLVIEVPNIASTTFRMTSTSWFPLDVPRHLQHFEPQHLDALLTDEGFHVERRVHFHWFDCVLAFVSFVGSLKLLGKPSGVHYFMEDFRRASFGARLRFLVLGSLLAAVSPVYSLVATLASGHGETYTVTARRKPR